MRNSTLLIGIVLAVGARAISNSPRDMQGPVRRAGMLRDDRIEIVNIGSSLQQRAPAKECDTCKYELLQECEKKQSLRCVRDFCVSKWGKKRCKGCNDVCRVTSANMANDNDEEVKVDTTAPAVKKWEPIDKDAATAAMIPEPYLLCHRKMDNLCHDCMSRLCVGQVCANKPLYKNCPNCVLDKYSA